jgi:Uma2 family endonuclease
MAGALDTLTGAQADRTPGLPVGVEADWREHRFTADSFMALVASGHFDGFPGRVELWNGAMAMAPPPGGPHMAADRRLLAWLVRAVAGDPTLVVQAGGTVRFGEQNVRQPDLAVLREPEDAGRLLMPSDITLLVEVAAATLRTDLTTKRELYAAFAVPEYWVVDVINRCVHVHRGPRAATYTDVTVHGVGSAILPQFAGSLNPAPSALELAVLFPAG